MAQRHEWATTLPLPTGRDMTYALVGSRQSTTSSITADRAATGLDTFGIENDYGAGTVPLTGAIGHD